MASRLTDAEKQGHQYRWLPRKCKRSVQPIKTLATVRTARLINTRLWTTNFWLWEFTPWYQSNLSSKLTLSLLRKVANLWWKFQKHESPKSWLPWCLFHHCPSVCAFQRRLGSLADWTAIQMPCQFWVCGESWVFLQLLTARPFKHNTRSQVFKFRIKQSLVTSNWHHWWASQWFFPARSRCGASGSSLESALDAFRGWLHGSLSSSVSRGK